MAQRLKRWESPRREGRNDKGKGGTARQRQRRKQFQALRRKLKEQSDTQNEKGGGNDASPFFGQANNHEEQDRQNLNEEKTQIAAPRSLTSKVEYKGFRVCVVFRNPLPNL